MARTRIFRRQNDGSGQHHQHADQGGPGGSVYEYVDIRDGPSAPPTHAGNTPSRQAMHRHERPARNPVYPVHGYPERDRAAGRQGRPRLEQYGTVCPQCFQPTTLHRPRSRPYGSRRRGREIPWRQTETGSQPWGGEWNDDSSYSARPAPGRSARSAPRNGQTRSGQLDTGLSRRRARSRRRAAEWAKRRRAENGHLPTPTAEGCSPRASPGDRYDHRGSEEQPSGSINQRADAAVGPANGQGVVCKETADKAVGTGEGPELPREGAPGPSGYPPASSYSDAVRSGPGPGLELEPLAHCEPISPANHADDLLNASPRAPDGDAFDTVNNFDDSILDD